MKEQDLIQPFTPWQDTTRGGNIYGSGTSKYYRTGGWRVDTPQFEAARCVNCMRCFLLCPDGSIALEDGQVTGIHYNYCKGCGICSEVCSAGAIHMMSRQEENAHGSER